MPARSPKLTITYEPSRALRLSEGDVSVTLPPSFAPSYGDLFGIAEGVASLLRGASEASWSWPVGSWHTPPADYRFRFTRVDDEVLVNVLRFDEPFSHAPDEEGETVFTTRCKARRLAVQIKHQLQPLLADAEHPHHAWRLAAYDKLNDALRGAENEPTSYPIVKPAPELG
jgi:hypothetical protein